MGTSDFLTKKRKTAGEKTQVVNSIKDNSTVFSDIPSERCEAIRYRFEEQGHGVREIARSVGCTYNDVVQAIIRRYRKRVAAAYQRSLLMGGGGR